MNQASPPPTPRELLLVQQLLMYLMLVLVLALEPPHSLRRLTLLRLLLLEPIVLQSQRTEKANPPLQLPAAAVLADAQHCGCCTYRSGCCS